MDKNRQPLGLDEDIDLSELTTQRASHVESSLSQQQKDALVKVNEHLGFVSRQPITISTRKRSPYVIQKNMKMRIGMPELLSRLSDRLAANSDQETIELAIKSLIEVNGFDDLMNDFEDLKR